MIYKRVLNGVIFKHFNLQLSQHHYHPVTDTAIFYDGGAISGSEEILFGALWLIVRSWISSVPKSTSVNCLWSKYLSKITCQ